MTTLYDGMRTTASKLLSKFGQTMTLTKRTSTTGAYDPSTGEVTPSETEYTGKGVILNYTDSYLHYGGRVGASSVQLGDRRVLFVPDDQDMPLPIASVDVITVDMVEWLVAAVSPVNPGGTTVLYDIQVRRE